MRSNSETARDAFVAVHQLRLHYREWGAADEPAVVLLHGLTGVADEWDPIAADLAERFRVVAVDQRGHGSSDRARDYAPERMVGDLAEVVVALGLEPVTIVGHSMGGIIAYLFAAARAASIRDLVVVDVGPDSITPAVAAGWTVSLRTAADASYADPEEALLEWRSANPRAREEELRHFVEHNLARGHDGRWRWRFDAARLWSFLGQLPAAEDQWAALRRVRTRTLVIRGADSEVLSAATAARMASEIRHADVVELPGGGHDLTVEQPAAMSAVLQAFISGA
jgi:esterase